jgi:hypothetical protein
MHAGRLWRLPALRRFGQQLQTPAQRRAERLCGVLNLCFGWKGSEPEITRERGYTGRVILSADAVQQLVAEHKARQR